MASWLCLPSVFRVKSSGLQHHRESGQAIIDKAPKPGKNKARRRYWEEASVDEKLGQHTFFEETVIVFMLAGLLTAHSEALLQSARTGTGFFLFTFLFSS